MQHMILEAIMKHRNISKEELIRIHNKFQEVSKLINTNLDKYKRMRSIYISG
jgi:hypothetical protein